MSSFLNEGGCSALTKKCYYATKNIVTFVTDVISITEWRERITHTCYE